MSEPSQRRHGRSSASGARALLPVFAGGLVGSAIRSGLGEIAPATPGSWPVVTLLVNVIGAFLLGAFLVARERIATSPWDVRFWAIGLFGSLTTFSAFSLEVFRLFDVATIASGVGYAATATFAGLAAGALGGAIARSVR